MRRTLIVAGLLLFIACNPKRDAPKSLCELPRSMVGWERTQVRWEGVILDASPHGILFIAEDCQGRGLQLADWPQDIALTDALRRRELGLVRVRLSGEITDDGFLSISKVHAVTFQPMTEEEHHEYFRSKGF